MGLDGATDILAKSKFNITIHTPFSNLIKYFRAYFKHKSTLNVVVKIEDIVRRLKDKLYLQCCYSVPTDSCNAMKAVKNLVKNGTIRWEYGCTPHLLNNFTEDRGKRLFKDGIKQNVNLARTMKIIGLLQNLVKALCKQKGVKATSILL